MPKFSALVAAVTAFARPAKASLPSTSGTSVLDVLVREPGVVFRGAIAYGPHPRHRLDLYEPLARRDGPIVLFFYGGSWTSGTRRTYEFVGTALASRGLTTVVADYRLHPEASFPAFVDDAARAYAWVDATLARRDGHDRPIHLMGHSAGAHIAALLLVAPEHLARHAPDAPRPAGLIGLSGPYAFDPTTWPTTAAIFAAAADDPDRARPARLVGSSPLPPALLLHGAADRTVGLFNTEDFAAALRAAGGRARTIVYPRLGHVGLITALAKPFRWRAAVLADVVAFVETTRRRPTA